MPLGLDVAHGAFHGLNALAGGGQCGICMATRATALAQLQNPGGEPPLLGPSPFPTDTNLSPALTENPEFGGGQGDGRQGDMGWARGYDQ